MWNGTVNCVETPSSKERKKQNYHESFIGPVGPIRQEANIDELNLRIPNRLSCYSNMYLRYILIVSFGRFMLASNWSLKYPRKHYFKVLICRRLFTFFVGCCCWCTPLCTSQSDEHFQFPMAKI